MPFRNDRMRALRCEAGLSFEKLAALTGLTKSYLCAIELRGAKSPSITTIGAVAQALGVTVDYLMGADDDRTNAEDQHFMRRYAQFPEEIKDKIRRIVDVLSE